MFDSVLNGPLKPVSPSFSEYLQKQAFADVLQNSYS